MDPDVTGSPFITYEATRLMERAHLQRAAYAFLLVGTLSLSMIRHIGETLLALMPLVIGLLWTIGLMRPFDLQINLANIWSLPLIIGAPAGGAQHGDGGGAPRDHHHGRFWEPDGRGPPRHLQRGTPPHHMLACGLVASLVVLTVVLRLITRPAVSAESAGVPISLLGQRR